MTCDLCDQPAAVAVVHPGANDDGPTTLCAYHLARFAIDLLAGFPEFEEDE